jgi:GT2 family glycosyltransferase
MDCYDGEKKDDSMIYVVMLAYNKTAVVEAAINRLLTKLQDTSKFTFILVDPNYPLNQPKDIYYIFEKYRSRFHDCSYMEISNDGVAGNYNQVISHFDFKKDDIVHFFDPDNAPRDADYLEKMAHVLSCPAVAYVTLERPDPDIPYGPEIIIDDTICYKIMRGHSWPMGAFRADFLNQAYPLAQDNGAWGFIEDWLYRKFNELGFIGVFLKGYVDLMIDGANQGTGGQDELYLQYQVECANRFTQDTFEKWLEKKLLIN